MLTGFEKYNQEMEKFEKSALYERCFAQILYYLTHIISGRFTKSRTLEDSYGLSGAEVRKIINHARKKAVPIISCEKGYAMAHTYGEIQNTIKQLEERGREILFVASRLKETFPEDIQTGMKGVT